LASELTAFFPFRQKLVAFILSGAPSVLQKKRMSDASRHSDEELITKHQGALAGCCCSLPRHTRRGKWKESLLGEPARLTLKNVSRGISSIHFYCLFCPEVGSDMQEGIRAKLSSPRALTHSHTDKIRAVADERGERSAEIKAKYRPESLQAPIYKNVCHSALSCASLAGWQT
jgi:hypothetical protein